MKQYIIEKKLSLNQIRELYKKYLINDKKWFFSLYGSKNTGQTKIRIIKRNKEIESYLHNKKINYSLISYDELEECGKIVDKYFDNFIEIWHQLALLILKLKNEKEFTAGLERVSHLYLNMTGKTYYEEAIEFANLSLQKSNISGYYSAIQNDNNKITNS